MTATQTRATRTTTNAGATVVSPPVVQPVRARRSRLYAAAAIALVIVGGLASVLLYTNASHTQQVLVAATDLDRGHVIQATDLTTISIADGQTSKAIDASQAGSVIGTIATVDLPTGSLITAESHAATLAVPDGQALVGLYLAPAHMPAQPLVAGDEVTIVPVASAEGGAAPSSSGTVTGIVSSTAFDEVSGNTIVDVYVGQTVAADLAGRASAGGVAIYLMPVGE